MAVSARSGSLAAAWRGGPFLCPRHAPCSLQGLAGLGKGWCVCTHGSCRGPLLLQILKLEDVTCGKLFSTAGAGGLDSCQSCCCVHGRDDGCR